ncbi:hypothetical protein [Streptomyces wuyuanensis]|uniref:hypothetical protein n=1 Tax=Streptomyces wuyuanensis TaxID=1196353 RepID=UPI0034449332
MAENAEVTLVLEGGKVASPSNLTFRDEKISWTAGDVRASHEVSLGMSEITILEMVNPGICEMSIPKFKEGLTVSVRAKRNDNYSAASSPLILKERIQAEQSNAIAQVSNARGVAVVDDTIYVLRIAGYVPRFLADGTERGSVTPPGSGYTGMAAYKDGARYVKFLLRPDSHLVYKMVDDTNNPPVWIKDLRNSQDAVVPGDGYVYITCSDSDGRIVKAPVDASADPAVTPFATGLNSPRGIAADSTFFYVANQGTNSIARIRRSDGSDKNINFVQGVTKPEGIAIASGFMYITCASTGSGDKVMRVRMDGSDRVDVVSGLTGARAMTTATDGTIYFVDASKLFKMSPGKREILTRVVSVRARGPYYLRVVDGLSVNLAGGNTADGSDVLAWPEGVGQNERWILDEGSIPGFHYIVCAGNTDKAITYNAKYQTAEIGSRIVGEKRQQWQLQDIGDGWCRIVSAADGLFLTADNPRNRLALKPPTASADQKFQSFQVVLV